MHLVMAAVVQAGRYVIPALVARRTVQGIAGMTVAEMPMGAESAH